MADVPSTTGTTHTVRVATSPWNKPLCTHSVGVSTCHAMLEPMSGRCPVHYRYNSYCEGGHLTLEQATLHAFCWCVHLPHNVGAHEAGIAVGHTAVDWSNYCHEKCKKLNERNKAEIGGLEINGSPKIVGIKSPYFPTLNQHAKQTAVKHF